jgi:hypothetical protein
MGSTQSPPVVAQLHDAMALEVANVFAIDKSAGGETAKALARRSAFASFSDDEPADDDAATANNKRLLFHASKVFNFVGLLSRGILPPKVVVSKANPSSSSFSFSFSFFVFFVAFAFVFSLLTTGRERVWWTERAH